VLNWLSSSLSGLRQVEGGGGAGAEGDFHALAVVRVHGQAGRGQNHRHRDAAAGGVVHRARSNNAVDVELHRRASLGCLDDVLDHPAGQVGVVVGGVHRGRTRAVGEASDIAAEGGVLTGFLTDGCDVNFASCDFEAPLAHRAHSCGGGVRNAGEVCAKAAGCCSCGNGHAASGGAKSHDAGCGVVRLDEVRTSGNCVGGRGAYGVGQGHRVIDLEAQVGADGDVGASRREGASSQSGDGGAGRGVIQGAGSARENGGHWLYRMDGTVTRAQPGLIQVSSSAVGD